MGLLAQVRRHPKIYSCRNVAHLSRAEISMNNSSIVALNHHSGPELIFQGAGRQRRNAPFYEGRQPPVTLGGPRFRTPGRFLPRSRGSVVTTHKVFITSDVCTRSLRLSEQAQGHVGLRPVRMAGSVAHAMRATGRACPTAGRSQIVTVSTPEAP